MLSRFDPEGEIAQDTLESLARDVNELIESLLKADVDPAFKEFALDQLDKIRLALTLYRFRGPKALADALDSITGVSIYAHTDLERAKETAPEWLEKVQDVFGKLFQAATYLEKYKRIADTAEPFIKPLLKLLGAGEG